MRKLEQEKVVRGVARYHGRRLSILQLLLRDGLTAQRSEHLWMLGGGVTVGSARIRCRNNLQFGGDMWFKL